MTPPVIAALNMRRMMRRQYPGSHQHPLVQAANKTFRRLYRKARRQAALDFNQKMINGSISLFYALFRRERQTCNPLSAANPRCVPQKHVDFWRQIFTSESSYSSLSHFLRQPDDLSDDLQITADDTLKAIQMSRKSASGSDGLNVLFVKRFEEALAPCLAKLFQDSLRGMQPKMKAGRTVLLPKTSPPSTDPGKYRPITILPALTRVFLKVFERKLRESFEAGPVRTISIEQAGFSQGRSAHEQAFILHLATDWNRYKRKPLFGAFLDIQKAFDSIHHGAFIEILRTLGVSPQWIHRVGHVLHGNTTTIFDETILIQLGTPQGGAPSALFCLAFLEDLVRCLKRYAGSTRGASLPWPTARILCCVLILLFADDIALIDSSIEDLQDLLDFICAWADTNYLCFSAPKSFAVHLAGPRICMPLTLLRLGNATIVWKDGGMYLGIPFYANSKRRSDHHAYPYKTQEIARTAYAIRRLLYSSHRVLSHNSFILRLAVTSMLYPQALYPTPVVDIDYKAVDVLINGLLRQAYHLPHGTHIAYMRAELGIWPIEFSAHVRALQFLWRLRYTHWVSKGFDILLEDLDARPNAILRDVKVLSRYNRILKLYGLDWKDLNDTSDYCEWKATVRRQVAIAIKAWLVVQQRRIRMPFITKGKQVLNLRVSSSTPLPSYLTLDASCSRVALQFRSDRVRYLAHHPPSTVSCQWCSDSGENTVGIF